MKRYRLTCFSVKLLLAYIIGGEYTREIIAEFKNDARSQFGTLARGRAWHGSITLGY